MTPQGEKKMIEIIKNYLSSLPKTSIEILFFIMFIYICYLSFFRITKIEKKIEKYLDNRKKN